MKIESRMKSLFREVQRPRLIWWWIIVLFLAAIMWYGFIQQIILGIPFGDKPAPDWMMVAIWVIFGIIFPLVMLVWVKFMIEVREDGLYVKFSPFHFQYRVFLFKDIKHYKLIEYSSLKRFGGWGIRINLEGERLYNLSGNEGLQLTLNNNQTLSLAPGMPNS